MSADAPKIHDVELEFRTSLAAPPERVFAAITGAEHVERWFCDEAKSDAREGGLLVLKWKRPGSSEHPFAGTWVAFDAPRSCAFAGGQPGHPDGYAGRINWTLEPANGGTRLVTRHSMPPRMEYAPLAALYALAWPRALDRLAAYLAPKPASAPASATTTLRFGHSPDADDAFMFYGFHTGEAVIEGCKVEHVLEDIQSLNRRALDTSDLEITAVSAHAYAYLADRYAVLACGASMGFGYGPVVVAREARPVSWLAGKRVAIPGPMTTAALLLKIECPSCETVDVMFDQIPEAVLKGEVDAGVIIHESQLTYVQEGLAKIVDFGELWEQRDHLPVPLGLDVVRRDLGRARMEAVSRGFRASIDAAFRHEDEAIRYALQFGRGLDVAQGKKFVHMYVNELTLDMGERGRKALETLYGRAVQAGVLKRVPPLEII